jgi:cytidylate kinase
MNEQKADISQMRAITVSRQYGSGGGEVARRLAEHLSWRLFDHQAVAQVAHEMGITQAEANQHDESMPSTWEQIWQSLQFIQPPIGVDLPVTHMPGELKVYLDTLHRVLEAAYAQGHVVIVGREAQVLLAGRSDVLNIRIVAPLAQRVHYVMQREQLNEHDARERIAKKDSDRNRLLKTEYHESPDNPVLYDLIANTDFMKLDCIANMVLLALKAKADQHSLREEERGPAHNIAPYTAPRQDFPPLSDISATTEPHK